MTRTVTERADVLPELAETFREHGYEGASLSALTQRTGLGKGSLYHFFPGGKAEMAEAVLAEIGMWFQSQVFDRLSAAQEPRQALVGMLRTVEEYFASGRRICLVGAFALGDTRDHFARAIASYFDAWTQSLRDLLVRAGVPTDDAQALAEDTVLRIQGAIVLARGQNDSAAFTRALRRLERDLLDALPDHTG